MKVVQVGRSVARCQGPHLKGLGVLAFAVASTSILSMPYFTRQRFVFNLLKRWGPMLWGWAWVVFCGPAHATDFQVGMREWPASGQRGPVTVFYPTRQPDREVARDSFLLRVAPDAPVARGNGYLIVFSHGSAANPWVSSDLAKVLVQAGFVVAVPEHAGDNTRDFSQAGPDSWKKRPQEITAALDAVLNDPDFARMVDPRKVGVYGGSAGGHTVLTLAGGRWSPARFAAHCRAHIQQDFAACAGFTTRLSGNWLDRPKQWVIQKVLNFRFSDPTSFGHEDKRIAAAVAEVPYAADFDPDTLRQPRMPLGLVLAGRDVMLVPQFHGDVVRKLCAGCEVLADLPLAGHGVMLSPLPPLGPNDSLFKQLLGDPPGFDRETTVSGVHLSIARFFTKHLVGHSGK